MSEFDGRRIFRPKGVRWIEGKSDDPNWRCIYSPAIKAWNTRMRLLGTIFVLLLALAGALSLAGH